VFGTSRSAFNLTWQLRSSHTSTQSDLTAQPSQRALRAQNSYGNAPIRQSPCGDTEPDLFLTMRSLRGPEPSLIEAKSQLSGALRVPRPSARACRPFSTLKAFMEHCAAPSPSLDSVGMALDRFFGPTNSLFRFYDFEPLLRATPNLGTLSIGRALSRITAFPALQLNSIADLTLNYCKLDFESVQEFIKACGGLEVFNML